ncbi:DUF3298 domain-containing protein [Samsonia erythrinae]|uniref:Uncharacterized protein DUF3298 n=1 Tax=Samsonia erythrinae TaxID=160434 RepID=A0A4R3VLZ9_9GAMM|nr:DUF3298 and DUF4163 domain-containing protein [Samsonia erythrinae]TCV04155.1 uncharacterized protein DUF3298 [Samsonia erythrinae]
MQLLPNKAQWKKWSLPSKMTAVGLYLTVIPLAFSAMSYVLVSLGHWLDKRVDVTSVTRSLADIEKESGITFNHDEANIQVNYPQLTYLLPNKFLAGINQEIENNVMSYINEYLLEYHVDHEIGLLSENMVSLRINQYYYYKGALNGDNSQFAINLQPGDDRIIDFFDIFDARRDALNEIKALITDKIGEVCEYGIFADKLEKPGFIPRFFMTPDTINFIFSEYEITPGVCGGVTVKISYDELIDYIRNDGPLGQLKPQAGAWTAGEHFINSMMINMGKFKE